MRIRPVAKRFYGAAGPQLPPVDDHWLINEVGDRTVMITNSATGHGAVLGLDQIHHWTSDPLTGERCGFLILNVQLHLRGDSLWSEPTLRPGEGQPDQFGNVRGWNRKNDDAYVARLQQAQRDVATALPSPATHADNSALSCVHWLPLPWLLIANAYDACTGLAQIGKLTEPN